MPTVVDGFLSRPLIFLFMELFHQVVSFVSAFLLVDEQDGQNVMKK
jgi:hypothetical protein